MPQDFKEIATEALKQCRIYQACIQSMRKDLQITKKASMPIDTDLLEKAVDSLIKSGSLAESNKQVSIELLQKDPNAALRVIPVLCSIRTNDANNINKRASNREDVTGGVLIEHQNKQSLKAVNDRQEGYAAVAKAFNLNS